MHKQEFLSRYAYIRCIIMHVIFCVKPIDTRREIFYATYDAFSPLLCHGICLVFSPLNSFFVLASEKVLFTNCCRWSFVTVFCCWLPALCFLCKEQPGSALFFSRWTIVLSILLLPVGAPIRYKTGFQQNYRQRIERKPRSDFRHTASCHTTRNRAIAGRTFLPIVA